MAADFQNVYRYNVCLCSSVVLADVLERNRRPAGENELHVVVFTPSRYLCYSFTWMIRGSSVLWPDRATSRETMWMLIARFPYEMWMLQQTKR